MEGKEIPADVLAQLETELDFADAAAEAVDIAEQLFEIRKGELAAARENFEQAENRRDLCNRAQMLANARLSSILKASGVVRTADGFALAEPAATGPGSATIDAGELEQVGDVFPIEVAWDGRTSSYGIGMGG